MIELNCKFDEKKSYWFNYRMDKYEYIETPIDFADYIPQVPAAIGLYRLYIKMGDSPIDAAQKTLTTCLRKS